MKSNKIGIYKYLILASLVLVIFIGFTYAFFSLTSTGSLNITGKATSTYEINMNVTGGKINVGSLIPILATDVQTQAPKTTFTVAAGNNNYSVKYTISLIDLEVSANLRNASFKWSLTCTNNPSKNKSGTFEGTAAGKTTKELTADVLITKNTTDSYDLRIWVEDDSTNQTTLLNGSFQGKLYMKSYMVSA